MIRARPAPSGWIEPPKQPDSGGRTWLMLLFAALLTSSATLSLVYLLWKYVPSHARRLEDLAATTLPRSTAYVLYASNWFVRLLPFLVLLALLVVALFLFGILDGPHHRALQTGAMLVILLGVAEFGACLFVLHGVHAAYAAAPRHGT